MTRNTVNYCALLPEKSQYSTHANMSLIINSVYQSCPYRLD